jgi:hypothetical protein
MDAPPVPEAIHWGTLVVGFAFGVVGSGIGAFMQATAAAFTDRRNRQFERMLKVADEIRHDIDSAVAIAAEYWAMDGTCSDCQPLERKMTDYQTRIMGALALVRRLDSDRFKKVDEVCENDFMDALTGGRFQVRGRPADEAAERGVRKFASRLSDRIRECSASPSARNWAPGRN